MPSLGTLLCAGMLLTVLPVPGLTAQRQEGSSAVPTVWVKSNLVILDVTVLDKKGRPVVKGLTKDDFAITEDNKPQRVFSFEAPDVHVLGANAEDQNLEEKAPVTIFVLDQLNSSVEEFSYIRHSVHRYLAAQPKQLKSPSELMVLGNRSLELVQGYTRSREDLLFAVKHLPFVLPFKYELAGSGWRWERAMQSYDALQEIALQNQGVPGRKNILWVGYGGPGIWTPALMPNTAVRLKRLVRETVNSLVDARVSLFVIYPGLQFYPDSSKHAVADNLQDVPARDMQAYLAIMEKTESSRRLGTVDPFLDDVSFGVFAKETGGNLFYNRNDVDGEIKQSQRMGAEYYTLTYQPPPGDEDGKFRYIRVTLRNPKLRAITKDGYYAPDKDAPADPRQLARTAVFKASQAPVPFTALDVKVTGIVRHPDTGTADFTVELKAKNIPWQAAGGGQSTANLIVAGVSLTGRRNILASTARVRVLTAHTQDSTRLAASATNLHLTLQVPPKTRDVRVVIVTEEGGRIGTADVDRATLDAAPASPAVPPG